jgi:peptidoglycan hydrolase-like protein with peptidoglycan-binding domain
VTESITASVGAGGVNQAADVRVVQDLLNRATGSHVAADGECGPHTRDAIAEYQKGFLARPDGRVDPGGLTLRKLVTASHEGGGAPRSDPASASGPTDGLRLQQLGGSQFKGWYSYSKPERQYGTDQLIQALLGIAAAMAKSGLDVGIGDMSLEQGGEMPPHTSHRTGKNADLRPVRNDNAHSPTNINDSSYGRDSTRVLVEAIQAQSGITQILFNDSEISGVRKFAGHDNHLHIQVR